jgi:predicted permease
MKENLAVTFAYLIAGMIIKRMPDFPSQTGKALNMFVIYISLPALILLKIPELIFNKEILITFCIPWINLISSAFIILIISRYFKWDKKSQGCLLLLIPLGNTAFLGIPMVETFFGSNAVSYALIYDQTGTFLAFTTYGSVIISLYGSNTVKPDFKNTIKKIIYFPPFIALIAALMLRYIKYPEIAETVLKSFSATLIPLVMTAVGYQLSLKLSKNVIKKLVTGLGVKLIIMPLTALLICKYAGFYSPAAQVAVFQSGMPPMVTAGALAVMSDMKPDLAAALVGAGIVLSFATLPLVYNLINIFL